MYEVFDSFCKLPTWDTSHPLDKRRFRNALNEVVHLPDFSPEEMCRYIQLNRAEPIWPKTAAQLDAVIDELRQCAKEEQERVRSRV